MSNFDDFNDDLDEVFETIMIRDDNDEDIEFVVIDSVEMDDNLYLMLVEADDIENEESDAYIFKQIGVDDDEIIFEEPNDEEFEKVSEFFRGNVGEYEIN